MSVSSPDAARTSLDAGDNWSDTARRLWPWPVAILVGFPIGGLLADVVVDGVDSVGAALGGGLVFGLLTWLLLALLLHRTKPEAS